jgi:type II secretory pathway pseudopilin PulG
MKPSLRGTAAFSLVEITFALGVAAFCLIAVLGMLPVGLKTQQASVQQTTANQIISQIFSALRADVRLPPGQESKICPDPPDPDQPCQWDQLHGHWRNVATPDTMYFTQDAKQIGNINGGPPAGAVFRAKITYYGPPAPEYTTSLAAVSVSWPAQVDPASGVPAGKVETFIAVNR